jgi:hypothetical protein
MARSRIRKIERNEDMGRKERTETRGGCAMHSRPETVDSVQEQMKTMMSDHTFGGMKGPEMFGHGRSACPPRGGFIDPVGKKGNTTSRAGSNRARYGGTKR